MKRIYTIGHSTRPIEDFVALLKGNGIETLVDVRTIPKSRFNPQYKEAALSKSLPSADIRYLHLSHLGGLRRASKDSINTGWRNLAFRGFADYMQTPSFQEGLEELEALGKESLLAIMCAEAVPWRCHRSLIADALTLRNWQVFHIMGKESLKKHDLTSFLHVEKGKMLYT